MTRFDDEMMPALIALAPGTQLRDGLERIKRGRTGALVVLGMDDVVESLCTGGIELDVPFSATILRELAKMDGAIVTNAERTRILRACVHLVPDSAIETTESGTRHRTAERVAKQTGHPVVSVSASMNTVALYLGNRRETLEDPGSIMSRANQALTTLERYQVRIDEVTSLLSSLEVEDLVTMKDVVNVVRAHELANRITEEIRSYALLLGDEGRLPLLQLSELTHHTTRDQELTIRDYLPNEFSNDSVKAALVRIEEIPDDELAEQQLAVARALGLGDNPDCLNNPAVPRGYRLLSKVPRLNDDIREDMVQRFGNLRGIISATAVNIQTVPGVSAELARSIREHISRFGDSVLLQRLM